MTKIAFLAKIEGFKTIKTLRQKYKNYDFVPGICTTPSCDYIDHVSSTTVSGHCPACQLFTVKSYLNLIGEKHE